MGRTAALLFVGASLLAKDVNACLLNKHLDLERFASKLAPTLVLHYGRNGPCRSQRCLP